MITYEFCDSCDFIISRTVNIVKLRSVFEIPDTEYKAFLWRQNHPRPSGQNTVMIPSFRTNKSEQTVQTQIRLLLEEQSDQGLHCLLFCLHFFFDEIPYGLAFLFEF